MERYICERILEEGTRLDLGCDAWADLYAFGDDELGWSLQLETDEPEWVTLWTVYQHFRRREQTWWEWQQELQGQLARSKVLSLECELARLREIIKLSSSSQVQVAEPLPKVGMIPLRDASLQCLRLRQCSALTGLSPATLRRAIRDGTLKAHTIGQGRQRPTYGISRADLEAYLEARRVQLLDPPRLPTTGVRTKSRHFD